LGNFSRGADYPAPWPDNLAWHFSSNFFLVVVNNLIYHVKFVLPYNLIIDLPSVTHVHMLIPMLSMSLSLTGGSSVPKRKHQFIQNEDGVLVDEVVIHQGQREAARKLQKEKLAKAQAHRRKGKETRPNYKTMPKPDYILVWCNNCYATPQDEDIEDRGFWCEEQWAIYHGVYEPLKNPTRPMHHIDLDHLCNKTYFDEVVSMLEKMGLTELATLQCKFNHSFLPLL
jgi:hypothetical protein